ncbi:hypothetical protein E4U21_002348 [Claviceps maximensis]|nr:hypothetical protein E4U21_002348 [Claviceps maximensis]
MHSLSWALSLVLFTAASRALGGATPDFVGARRDVPKSLIYEFADETASGPHPYSIFDKLQESASFYATLGSDARVITKYDSDLLRGCVVQYSSHEGAHAAAARMAQQPAVKKVWPVHYYPRPKSNVIPVGDLPLQAQKQSRGLANDTFSPHVMMQVDKLHARGVTGKDIIVAVIDDGVDYHNPALGRCFGKGCLVTAGYDLVGNAYNGTSKSIPVPGPDPMACGSHGTHVCGIIAAQPNPYGFTGVAPGAKLHVYKVLGCTGGTGTDVLISAAIKAVEDGAQIITASIGGSSGFSEDLWSNLMSKIARERGIPCTVAASNDGPEGAFYPSGMANGPDVMSIASFENVETPSILTAAKFSVVGGPSESFGYVLGAPGAWSNVNLPLWALHLDPTVVDDGCSPFPGTTPDLSKYVVLVRRGTCTFTQKATYAAAKGARYIMLYDYEPGAFNIDVRGVEEILGSGMVQAGVGETWIRSLSAGKTVILHMTDPSKAKTVLDVTRNKATGGAVSDYSSWGPTMEMNFKPQFGAPGHNILSTMAVSHGSYGVNSGTSMSTPMAAGVIALLGEYRRDLNITLIRNLLSATSKAQLYNPGGKDAKFFNFLAPAAQQGSGLIQAFDAAVATTILDPSNLAFNDTDHLKTHLNFTITNHGKNPVTYKIAQRPAGSVYVLAKNSIAPSKSPNEFVAASASLDLSLKKTVIRPGASQLIRVSAIPPTGIDERRLLLWSGYITVNGSDGSAMSLPYEGLAGSLRNSTTLAARASFVSNATDPDLAPVAANSRFVLPRPGQASDADSLPVAMANLTLGSPTVVISLAYRYSPPWEPESLWEVDSSPLTWQTRGQTGVGFDGKLRNGTYIAAGLYKFVIRALRIAGEPLNPGDWDTSETPPFSILYRQ